MADSIRARAEEWAGDEISRQRLGEDYGYAIGFGAAMVQTPAGPRQVPVWTLLLTARNPLLGEGPLYHGPIPVGTPAPLEKDVRAQVADGIRQLRDLAASKLAGQNGKPRLTAGRP